MKRFLTMLACLCPILAGAGLGPPNLVRGVNEIWLDTGGDLSAAIVSARSGQTIILHSGTFTGLDKAIPTADSLYITSATPWICDAVVITDADSLIKYNSNKIYISGVTFNFTGSGSGLWIGAYNANFTNCRFIGAKLNMGTGWTQAKDCQFDITAESGHELRGTHEFWRCNWGYQSDSTHYFAADHKSGNTYLYQCQGWGATMGFHMPGTAGVASSVTMYDCYFKAYGSTSYGIGMSELEQLWSYGGFYRNNSSVNYTIYAHDSSSIHLFNPCLRNDGAANNLVIYLTTQGASEVWNGEYYGSSIKLDTCDVAGSADGFCNFNGFFASNSNTPLNDLYSLARFSGNNARTSDIYGTSFMSYVWQFPDSLAIASGKNWHAIQFGSNPSAGALGWLGFNSATSSQQQSWNINKFDNGNLLRFMQGSKLQAYNGTGYVDVLTTNGASGTKITVTGDTLHYGTTYLPPR